MNAKLFQILFYYHRLRFPTIQVTAKLPLAQAVLESANFTSHVYEAYNNCLGMMAPQARNTTCTNKGGKGYANYTSVSDCIEDYLYWLEALGLLDDAKLTSHIAAGKYAADKSYFEKVTKQVAFIEKNGEYISPLLFAAGASAAAVAAAAGVVYTYNQLT